MASGGKRLPRKATPTAAPRPPASKAAPRPPASKPRDAAPRDPAPFTVFLDRDGVFDVAPRYLIWRWKGFHWIPGAREAFARLNQPHIKTCLATNQPFVGLGVLPQGRLARLHARMMEGLREAGGRLDRIEVSTVPWGIPSRRRKPSPGMLEDAAAAFAKEDWPVDKTRAVMVGDLPKDAQAAKAFGIHGIVVATTHPRAQLERELAKCGLRVGIDTTIADDLGAAVDEILRRAV